MARSSTRKEYLSTTNRRIAEFIERYRVGTAQLIAHGVLDDSKAVESAARRLRRLAARGVLRRVEVSPRLPCYVLTRRGAGLIGAPYRTPRPLTEQSLPAVLAIAGYCVESGITRLTDREYRQRFPELWRHGLHCSVHYLAKDADGPRLGVFVVDRGGAGRRVYGKLRRLIRQRASLPAFASLLAAGRVRVTILTGLPEQQRNIERRLPEDGFAGATVEVALVSTLGDWLTQR